MSLRASLAVGLGLLIGCGGEDTPHKASNLSAQQKSEKIVYFRDYKPGCEVIMPYFAGYPIDVKIMSPSCANFEGDVSNMNLDEIHRAICSKLSIK